jgi:hypothetical protein
MLTNASKDSFARLSLKNNRPSGTVDKNIKPVLLIFSGKSNVLREIRVHLKSKILKNVKKSQFYKIK